MTGGTCHTLAAAALFVMVGGMMVGLIAALTWIMIDHNRSKT